LAALVGAIALLAALTATTAAAEPDPSAEAFVNRVGGQAIAILNDGSASAAEQDERLRALLRDNVALSAIGRFALGRHWRAATEAQRRAYLDAFEGYVLGSYVPLLRGRSAARFSVLRSDARSARDSVVQTRLQDKNGQIYDWRWRVLQTPERYAVVDLSLEGISMAVGYRSDFQSFLSHRGLDQLVAMLKERSTR